MSKKKRPSKLDQLTMATIQDYAHASTADIMRIRIVLGCEATVVEDEVVALTARITEARQRRARVEAKLLGLGAVIERR